MGNPSGRARPRGNIEELPSGSLRVRVYAGVDVLTGSDLYLRRTVPAGRDARPQAEAICAELIRQVEQGRQPRTNATLGHLVDIHLTNVEMERRNKQTLQGYARKHIHGLPIGGRTIGEVDVQVLETFYAELRRCRDHCDGRPTVRHYTPATHRCTSRCQRHVCRPLAAWTVRKIHFLISAAYQRAIRWKWIDMNPTRQAEVAAAPSPDPDPPTAEQAAALVNECWRWGDLGPYVWLAMTTGARRGELCALRWKHLRAVHADRGPHDCIAAGCRWELIVRRAIAQDIGDGAIREKDTKTHQRRHIALNPETVAVLAEHRQRCERDARTAGATLTDAHYIFAATPDGAQPRKPSTMSNRYKRCAQRLGIDTCLKNLRHYSATELITAGVDIRTVAGRLGHSGGGTTTLKVYAAWVAAADQHASIALMNRMPQRPTALPDAVREVVALRTVHEQLAADLYDQWRTGALPAGTELTVKGIAQSRGVTEYAAHQAIQHLNKRGVLQGVWLCLRSEVALMQQSGGGAIVNTSSVAGLVGIPFGLAAYTAAKHGVIGLTKAAALKYATAGIRVSAICPGGIRTAMIDRAIDAGILTAEAAAALQPVNRLGTPKKWARPSHGCAPTSPPSSPEGPSPSTVAT